jgi:hypothetical protein
MIQALTAGIINHYDYTNGTTLLRAGVPMRPDLSKAPIVCFVSHEEMLLYAEVCVCFSSMPAL